MGEKGTGTHDVRKQRESNHAPANAFADDNDVLTLDYIKLCRIRVTLLSTRVPTMDAFGVCKPLPAVCLKNVIVISWPSPLSINHCVESKPIANKWVADRVLSYTLNNALIGTLTPQHHLHTAAVGEGITKLTQNCRDIFERTISNIYNFITEERDFQFVDYILPQVITQKAVPIGLVSSHA